MRDRAALDVLASQLADELGVAPETMKVTYSKGSVTMSADVAEILLVRSKQLRARIRVAHAIGQVHRAVKAVLDGNAVQFTGLAKQVAAIETSEHDAQGYSDREREIRQGWE